MNASTNARAEASSPRLVRTLDDYRDTLGIAAYRGPVVLSQVVTAVHGREATRAQREETELALDELVAQRRAERDSAGRYQLVRSAAEPETEQPPDAAVDSWADDGGAPPAADAPDPVTYTEPEVHSEAADVHSEPQAVQGDPCVQTSPEVTVRHCPVADAAPEPLRSIDDVAARHAPRPELDSVEAVLEEAAVLRKRTESALAVASRDVEEANARERAAREAHELAFNEAKLKTERLRNVHQLAQQLGVGAGTPA